MVAFVDSKADVCYLLIVAHGFFLAFFDKYLFFNPIF